MFTLLHYVTPEGKSTIAKWLEELPDRRAAARVAVRMQRLEQGIFGDCKPLREGVWELRIDYGPGYRVYYSQSGKTVILLLCGGDKRTQKRDIEQAITFLNDYKRRQT